MNLKVKWLVRVGLVVVLVLGLVVGGYWWWQSRENARFVDNGDPENIGNAFVLKYKEVPQEITDGMNRVTKLEIVRVHEYVGGSGEEMIELKGVVVKVDEVRERIWVMVKLGYEFLVTPNTYVTCIAREIELPKKVSLATDSAKYSKTGNNNGVILSESH